MGRTTWRTRHLGAASCISAGHGDGRNARTDGRARSGHRVWDRCLRHSARCGGGIRSSSSHCFCGVAGRTLRHLPWPCPRNGTPARPECAALQHGLRDRDWMFACARHWHRHRSRMGVGSETPAHSRRRGRYGRCLFHVEGVDMKNASPSRLQTCFIVTVPVVLCAAPAQAHLNSTGMGPIYDGLIHFLTRPEDLVPALALALLAGLRGAAYGRRAALTLPVAWLVGSLSGLSAAASPGSAALSSLWFLLLGGLVIADAKLSLGAMTGLTALLGLVHGYLNGTGMGHSGFAIIALLGLISGVFVLIVLAAAFVVQLRAYWARIAVRVAGSWIAASGLLLLGWSLRGS